MPKIPLTHANIIELLGIETLPLNDKKEIVASATELVETRTLNRVLERFDNTKKEELLKILESQDVDAAQEFFSQNNIDLWEIMESEIEKVKQELLEIAESE